MSSFFCLLVFFVSNWIVCESQFDRNRCHCLCPSPSVVNGTHIERKVYIGNLPSSACNCDALVIPQVFSYMDGSKFSEFCAHCECKYQSRNILMIKIAVSLVICVVSLLVIYMLFLICLDPMLRRRGAKNPYLQHRDDEEDNIFANVVAASSASTTSANVPATGVGPSTSAPDFFGDDSLAGSSTGASPAGVHSGRLRTRSTPDSIVSRVNAEQSKWMRRVQEQRKNIFTDHTMLN